VSRDLVCTGRIYADLVFSGLDAAPAPGREVFAAGLTLVPGGGPFITGSYAAALGLDVALWGIAPAAPFDACVRAGLARNRIADMTEPPPPGTDPQVTAALTGGGDRAFVTRRAGPVRPSGPLPKARHLHIGEMTSALEMPGLIDEARAAGMTVSLDCGWDGAMFSDPRVAAVIAAVDLFLPNEDEAAALQAAGVVATPRALTVVKAGASGARAGGPGGSAAAPAVPAQVIDTTGAGDAFNAGFLAAWLAGQTPEACLRLGNLCGAVAVARIGGAEELPDLSGLRDAGVQVPGLIP
jgi:sugar/nucleoside kinase (ribokinase family)